MGLLKVHSGWIQKFFLFAIISVQIKISITTKTRHQNVMLQEVSQVKRFERHRRQDVASTSSSNAPTTTSVTSTPTTSPETTTTGTFTASSSPEPVTSPTQTQTTTVTSSQTTTLTTTRKSTSSAEPVTTTSITSTLTTTATASQTTTGTSSVTSTGSTTFSTTPTSTATSTVSTSLSSTVTTTKTQTQTTTNTFSDTTTKTSTQTSSITTTKTTSATTSPTTTTITSTLTSTLSSTITTSVSSTPSTTPTATATSTVTSTETSSITSSQTSTITTTMSTTVTSSVTSTATTTAVVADLRCHNITSTEAVIQSQDGGLSTCTGQARVINEILDVCPTSRVGNIACGNQLGVTDLLFVVKTPDGSIGNLTTCMNVAKALSDAITEFRGPAGGSVEVLCLGSVLYIGAGVCPDSVHSLNQMIQAFEGGGFSNCEVTTPTTSLTTSPTTTSPTSTVSSSQTSSPSTTGTLSFTTSPTTSVTSSVTTTPTFQYKYVLVFEGATSTNTGANKRFSTSKQSSARLFVVQSNADLEDCEDRCDALYDCKGIYFWTTKAGHVRCAGLNNLGSEDGVLEGIVSYSYRREILTTSTIVTTTTQTSTQTSTATTSPNQMYELVYSTPFRFANGKQATLSTGETNILFSLTFEVTLRLCQDECTLRENCKGIYLWYPVSTPNTARCNGLAFPDTTSKSVSAEAYSYLKRNTSESNANPIESEDDDSLKDSFEDKQHTTSPLVIIIPVLGILVFVVLVLSVVRLRWAKQVLSDLSNTHYYPEDPLPSCNVLGNPGNMPVSEELEPESKHYYPVSNSPGFSLMNSEMDTQLQSSRHYYPS
eukprot:m.172530 g.172530  ORF g.172530 m.172530 type:complete len:826 (-) comp15371_c0_seq5:3091-5568(-)